MTKSKQAKQKTKVGLGVSKASKKVKAKAQNKKKTAPNAPAAAAAKAAAASSPGKAVQPAGRNAKKNNLNKNKAWKKQKQKEGANAAALAAEPPPAQPSSSKQPAQPQPSSSKTPAQPPKRKILVVKKQKKQPQQQQGDQHQKQQQQQQQHGKHQGPRLPAGAPPKSAAAGARTTAGAVPRRAAASPPPEQPAAKRRKVQAGAPKTRQLEAGRTLYAFDTNVLLGAHTKVVAAWELIAAGGGERVQALIPMKVLLEVRCKASMGPRASKAVGLSKERLRAKQPGAQRALQTLKAMMQNHRCCRVQREDEVFRKHPMKLQSQRGDDAILDCLLHFSSLGAQVVLVTQDKGFTLRALEHGVRCIEPQPALDELPLALQGAEQKAEKQNSGGSTATQEAEEEEEGGGRREWGRAGTAGATGAGSTTSSGSFHTATSAGGAQTESDAEVGGPAAYWPPWTAQHDLELKQLLLQPAHQRAAPGTPALPSLSREAFAAIAARMRQPLERVLLAAAQVLAGASVAGPEAGGGGGGVPGGVHGSTGGSSALRAAATQSLYAAPAAPRQQASPLLLGRQHPMAATVAAAPAAAPLTWGPAAAGWLPQQALQGLTPAVPAMMGQGALVWGGPRSLGSLGPPSPHLQQLQSVQCRLPAAVQAPSWAQVAAGLHRSAPHHAGPCWCSSVHSSLGPAAALPAWQQLAQQAAALREQQAAVVREQQAAALREQQAAQEQQQAALRLRRWQEQQEALRRQQEQLREIDRQQREWQHKQRAADECWQQHGGRLQQEQRALQQREQQHREQQQVASRQYFWSEQQQQLEQQDSEQARQQASSEQQYFWQRQAQAPAPALPSPPPAGHPVLAQATATQEGQQAQDQDQAQATATEEEQELSQCAAPAQELAGLQDEEVQQPAQRQRPFQEEGGKQQDGQVGQQDRQQQQQQQSRGQGQREGADSRWKPAWLAEALRLADNAALRELVCGKRKRKFVSIAKHLGVGTAEVMQAYEEEKQRQRTWKGQHVRFGGEEEEEEEKGEAEDESDGGRGEEAASEGEVPAQGQAQGPHPREGGSGSTAAEAPAALGTQQQAHAQQRQQKQGAGRGGAQQQAGKGQTALEVDTVDAQEEEGMDDVELAARMRPLVLGALGALRGRQGTLREVQQAIAGCPQLACWLSGAMRGKVGGVSRWRTATKQLLRSPSVARQVGYRSAGSSEDSSGSRGRARGSERVYQLMPCALDLD